MEPGEMKVVIENSLKEKNFKNCEIDFASAQKVSDGHLSDVTFVNVHCLTRTGSKKGLHLALKQSKRNEAVSDLLNQKGVFKQEMLFYEMIFPIFLDFQIERKIEQIFDPLPKIYKAITIGSTDLIILENVRASGFEMCNNRQPLPLQHLKLALQYYGRFHAISFALRDQKPALYQQMADVLKNTIKRHISRTVNPYLPKLFEQLLALLAERHEFEHHKRLKCLLEEKNIIERAFNLFDENTGYSVINHTDPWINNLMFHHKVSFKVVAP